MAKLYPPILEGTLPAFYGTELTVPFSLNPAVSITEVKQITIKIRTIQSNAYILTKDSVDFNLSNEFCQVKFQFDNESIKKLNIGQFYKVQLAFVSDTGIGHYSTVGIIKYTSIPTVSIEGMNLNDTNLHNYKYKGIYLNNQDQTEKVYSYRFDLFKGNELIDSSGDLIHNNSLNQTQGQSEDTYTFNQDLDLNVNYYIQYSIITINGIKISTEKYRIIQSQLINPMIKARLSAKLDTENGCVVLKLESEDLITGNFKLVRSKYGENKWQELFNFTLEDQDPSVYEWKDFIVEQGVKYIYAIQQYNSYGIHSNKTLYTEIIADFDHMFLLDANKQLKIKFNPKVSSFKDTILETRTNTIGSKYPFIFRNGNVKYKEFPISGLISCLMDEDFLFMEYFHDNSTNLISENIAAERNFKLEVLEWLNNGEPKIFRSSTEGNYIVRLMNCSLAPVDALGRMLHTFTATAIEIDNYDEETLMKYGFLATHTQEIKKPRWQTVPLTSGSNLIPMSAISLQFRDVINPILVNIDGKEILIQDKYNIEVLDNININSVIVDTASPSGTLTYGYYLDNKSEFDSITKYTILDAQVRRFDDNEPNIYDTLNNHTDTVQYYYYIKCWLQDEDQPGSIIFNGINVDLSETKNFEVTKLEKIEEFIISENVIAEVCYRQQILEFEGA